MYGAGNIGRGFIGQIFFQSGYELTFIDVADSLVEALNREKRYPVRILSEGTCEDIWIEGVSAVNGNTVEEAANAIAEADILATAVGVRALPFAAPVIAAGLTKRFAKTDKPLNIIICENLIDADTVLGTLLKSRLSVQHQEIFDKSIGLVMASIGRMVPYQTEEMQSGNPLRICVEAYSSLPVDKAAFKGNIPSLTGMHPYDNFNFYIQRKLFIHNLGHATCGYLGMIHGDKYLYEAVANKDILVIAQNAMQESAQALSAQHTMPIADLHSHISDLLERFSNKALGDTCARVGADTVRKLGKNDRFIGAILLCAQNGINPVHITIGAAAALFCHLQENNLPQTKQSAQAALAEISELPEGSAETEKLLSCYSAFALSPGNFKAAVETFVTP